MASNQRTCEGLLADLELLEEVRELRLHRVVTHAALDQVVVAASALHDLLPPLVDVAKSLGFLWQLLGDVTANKHSLEIPEIVRACW